MEIGCGLWLDQRERVRRLSSQSQKVLLMVHELGSATNKEIAKRTFIQETSVSVTLKKLQKQGILSCERKSRCSNWSIVDTGVKIALGINTRNWENDGNS